MEIKLSNFFIIITLYVSIFTGIINGMNEKVDFDKGASYIEHVINDQKFTHSNAKAMGCPETLDISGLTFNCENVFYEIIYEGVHVLYVCWIDTSTCIRFLITIKNIDCFLDSEKHFYKFNIEKRRSDRVDKINRLIRYIYIIPESIDKNLTHTAIIKMTTDKIVDIIDDFRKFD
jgi:hypothetical protein